MQVEETKYIDFKKGNYYNIIEVESGRSLTVPWHKNYKKAAVTLQPFDKHDVQQIWLVEEVQPKRYEIIHGIATFVLENEGHQLRLAFGKQKNSQLFFFERSRPKQHPNEFWIKEMKSSTKLMQLDNGKIQLKQRDPSDPKTYWELRLVEENKVINSTCFLEYAHSSQVIDVPEASDKEGISLIQYPLNKRFNQRWILQKVKDGPEKCYTIKSLKTDLYLDIKGESSKFGTPIIQYRMHNGKNQQWILQEQGKRLYIIQSAMDPKLFMGIKDNSLKEGEQVVTIQNEAEGFWRIFGHIPN